MRWSYICTHAGGHVGADDPRPDLEDGKIVRREPHGEELGGHGEASLAHAVLASVGRGHFGRDRCDEDDRGAERRVALAPGNHVARHRLGQEVRALQVRAYQLLEALFGRFEQIGADSRRAAGVVDEGVQRSVPCTHRFDERAARLAARDVGGDVSDAAARRLEFGDDRRDLGGGSESAQYQIPSLADERARDTESDPSGAAGD